MSQKMMLLKNFVKIFSEIIKHLKQENMLTNHNMMLINKISEKEILILVTSFEKLVFVDYYKS